MRIIKETNIDFIGKTFLAGCLSITILIVGLASLVMNGGPKLSIDFKGGTLVAVNFTKPIDIELSSESSVARPAFTKISGA